MKSFIEINPDFKRVVVVLKRIADALEMHLLLAYNYRTTSPSKAELAGEEPSVDFSSDEDTMLREAEAARREIEQSDEAGLVK